MAEEFEECTSALKRAANLLDKDDIRMRFCQSLMCEKKKDYPNAMDGYMACLSECGVVSEESVAFEKALETHSVTLPPEDVDNRRKRFEFMKELSGEVMLRMAVLRKETGALDQSMQMCNKIATDNFNDSIRANALCLKVAVLFVFFISIRAYCMK
jgi:hypothetical protein